MISFDEALDRLVEFAKPLGAELVALADAHGRILAEPVIAAVDSPPANVSAMDGYAVIEADLQTLPQRLMVASEIFAGTGDAGRIKAGECARIFTGAPVPAGADRVIVQEVVSREADVALFDQPLSPARHIRQRGGDFTAGTILLPAGTRLGPRQMVAAAGADQAALRCIRRPRVQLLATGDELAEPGTARDRCGAIPESVSFGIDALIRQWGGDVVARHRLTDRLEEMEAVARTAVDDADLVVVTGGASVGEKDFAKAMFQPIGLDLAFAKVAIKPGKPVWLGRAGGTLVLGLPGNPTSAMTTARLLLAPLVAGLSGRKPKEACQWIGAPLSKGIAANGDRENFLRARRLENGDVEPIGNQDSGAQHALAEADLLLRRTHGAPALSTGAEVYILDF